jgi:Derlin-2/3
MAISSRSSVNLELDHYPWKSPDYAWQLTLAAGAILVRFVVFPCSNVQMTCFQAANLPLGTYLHSRALTLCILYLSSALAPAGTQSSFMGLITFPMEYLPYVMIGAQLFNWTHLCFRLSSSRH